MKSQLRKTMKLQKRKCQDCDNVKVCQLSSLETIIESFKQISRTLLSKSETLPMSECPTDIRLRRVPKFILMIVPE